MTVTTRSLWRCTGCKHQQPGDGRPLQCGNCGKRADIFISLWERVGPLEVGRLVRRGSGRLSHQPVEVWECVDCETRYTREPGREITCNGFVIAMCPWCSDDAQSRRAR